MLLSAVCCPLTHSFRCHGRDPVRLRGDVRRAYCVSWLSVGDHDSLSQTFPRTLPLQRRENNVIVRGFYRGFAGGVKRIYFWLDGDFLEAQNE